MRLIAAVLVVVALVFASVRHAEATWSICIVDTESGEVATGTVTCLNQFDLLAIVPVVVVGKGAGSCQASGDFGGIRRPVIFDGLVNGTDPEDILEQLAQISGHQSRQYGIVDRQGRAITFTGTSAFQWAGGVTGQTGNLTYAIQGNILAGDCVVPAIEDAIINSPGDLPEKLMAGMRAARDAGGDGRCSCSPNDPTGCGCPPLGQNKSGHIGGVITARIGDTDDTICNASGCADGDYFMRLNVAFQGNNDPDPVDQLDDLFAAWRADLVGRPDAVQSVVSFEPADGEDILMTIELRDWQQLPITVSADVAVEHEPDSANATIIGPVQNQGGGVYTVVLTPTGEQGLDRFRVTADDAIRPVILMPPPENCVGDPGKDCNNNCIPDELEEDCNENGIPDDCDIDSGFSQDVNGNGIPDECESTLYVESFFVGFGTLQSGGIDELRESDDQRVVIGQRAAVSPTLPVVRVDLFGTSAFDTILEMIYTLEASASALPAGVPQRIQLFDFGQTGTFVTIDERTATLGDSVVEVVITDDPSRFIRATNGQVYARLSWFDPGNVVVPRWVVRIDQATWQVTP